MSLVAIVNGWCGAHEDGATDGATGSAHVGREVGPNHRSAAPQERVRRTGGRHGGAAAVSCVARRWNGTTKEEITRPRGTVQGRWELRRTSMPVMLTERNAQEKPRVGLRSLRLGWARASVPRTRTLPDRYAWTTVEPMALLVAGEQKHVLTRRPCVRYECHPPTIHALVQWHSA